MIFDHMNFWIDLFNRYTTNFTVDNASGVMLAEIETSLGRITLSAKTSFNENDDYVTNCIVKIEDEMGEYVSGFKFNLIDNEKYKHKYIVMKFKHNSGVDWTMTGSYIEGSPNLDRREEVSDILTNIMLVS